jgi:hypothetical protein
MGAPLTIPHGSPLLSYSLAVYRSYAVLRLDGDFHLYVHKFPRKNLKPCEEATRRPEWRLLGVWSERKIDVPETIAAELSKCLAELTEPRGVTGGRPWPVPVGAVSATRAGKSDPILALITAAMAAGGVMLMVTMAQAGLPLWLPIVCGIAAFGLLAVFLVALIGDGNELPPLPPQAKAPPPAGAPPCVHLVNALAGNFGEMTTEEAAAVRQLYRELRVTIAEDDQGNGESFPELRLVGYDERITWAAKCQALLIAHEARQASREHA